MITKQLSVFIENREGRLKEVAEILKNNNINIISFSIADTSEFGMLRMVVSEPEKAKDVLRKAKYSAKLTEVITVNLPNEEGTLFNLLSAISDIGVNIEYIYTSLGDVGSIVLKTVDQEQVNNALKAKGFDV